ncbi:MAG: hypothetical protein HN842_10695 [Gammaproteobacteria bacterium]|jgi:uptake hydrogenase large subunit|nr:hypothetical protein [Gammaproteobacteria bacterium]MBT7308676.1 hypothetical protein [Gammaproteobacteria bacterium]
MNLEGRISIDLSYPSHDTGVVTLSSSRPVHASTLFEGKTIEETLQTLPLLFSICSTAQACAAVRACEQATKSQPPTGVEPIRQQLLSIEMIREHLWRILLGWSERVGTPPPESALAEVMRLQQELRQSLTAGDSPFRIVVSPFEPDMASFQQAVQQLKALLKQTVLGVDCSTWLQIESIDQLHQWISRQQGVATQLLHKIWQQQWHGLGRCLIPPLPTLEWDRLNQALSHSNYVEQPEWAGEPAETTPLTRTDSPLLHQLQLEYGNGLLVRLIARLTELAQLVESLDQPHSSTPSPVGFASGESGIGCCEAARGLLVHRVTLENEQIRQYQILAPTEWNFHPDGVVVRALQQLPAESPHLQQQASLIIHAIDPCVGYDLTINQRPPAH